MTAEQYRIELDCYYHLLNWFALCLEGGGRTPDYVALDMRECMSRIQERRREWGSH